MVPNGWNSKTLGDIATISSGGTPSRKEPSNWDNGNIPWVTTTEVKFNTIIETEQKITNEGLKNSSAKLYPKDTILMAMYGQGKTRGQVAKLGFEASTNQACAAIQLKDNFEVDFYYQYLMNSYKRIRHLANSGGQENLSGTIIKKIPVPIPPLPEQQKIAKILTTWDKAIETTERLIENSKQQKKALMQQLLTGKKRLLDDEGKRFNGEWEEFNLKDISEFIKDGTHGTHKRYETGILMLSAKNITKQHTVNFDDTPRISEEDYNKIHVNYIIQSGDILLTVVGTLGRVAIVPDEFAEKFTLQRSVAIIRVKATNANNQFLKQLFSGSEFTNLLHRKSNSTAQAGIYLGELGKLKISLPPLKEQKKIATVLSNADKEIELLEQQLDDLQQEKKALMQVLLTGKVRVKVDDRT